MAKSPTTATPKTNGDAQVDAPAASTPLVLTYGDYSVEAAKLPAKAIAYLLQNGFSQSMTDAAAFTKEQKTVKGVDDAPDRPMTDDEVAALAKTKRDARFAAILAGEVGVRVGGPRVSPFDRTVRDIVDERIAAICSARKVALPKGDVLNAARAKILAKSKAEIEDTARNRLAVAAAAADDLGDLLDATPAA
jgi:hypothetical protein